MRRPNGANMTGGFGVVLTADDGAGSALPCVASGSDRGGLPLREFEGFFSGLVRKAEDGDGSVEITLTPL